MKPYLAYKDSGIEWLGEIPANWEVKRLKFLVSQIVDKGESNGFTVALENIESQTGRFIVPENPSELSGDLKRFKSNDVLFNKLRPYLAKVYLPVKDGACVGELLVLRPACYILSKFLYFRLLSRDFIEIVNGSTYGAKMPRASWDDFIRNLLIPTPDLNEQERICNFLDHKTNQIDDLITKKEKLIELLKEERTAIINQAVTKGLDPDVPMIDSGIEWLGEIPKHWEAMRFKNISRVRQGLQIAQEKRLINHENGAFEYITIRSINNPKAAKEYIPKPSERVICKPENILMARTGATGEVISGLNGVFHNNFFLVDYDQSMIIKEFLVLYLKNSRVKEHLLLLAGVTTIPDLNHGDFLNTPIFLPPITEQNSIVKEIESMIQVVEKTIVKVENEIELLNEYKTSLINEAVTGKIDVRDYRLEESIEI